MNTRYRKELFMAAACFLMAFLCFAVRQRTAGEALAGRIAPGLLRFHVLANSNSSRDQALKLEVRDLLLNRLGSLSEEELAGAGSVKEAICGYVDAHHRELEEEAAAYMASKGFPYGASVRVTRCYFPTKAYGDIVLPCGTYDAVQVTLGQGRGRNWWCLLYPRLCFVGGTIASVPDDSRQQLQELVGEDDYAALLAHGGVKIRFRLKIAELLSGIFHDSDVEDGPSEPTGPSAPSPPTSQSP